MDDVVLKLKGLKTHFPVERGLLSARRVGTVRAVDGVDLELRRGEVLGLVGESGCGKSTLARTILQLVPATSGQVVFMGQDLCRLPASVLRAVRPRLQIVFQDPYASLNPRMTVFDAIAEPLRAHRIMDRGEVPGRVAELMRLVGLAPRLVRKYPHEFSGGQRQRIAIARALALEPELLIADEPVSALDVSVQAQILNLLSQLCRKTDVTLILISHDLSVVKHLAHRIAVMYLGKIVEIGEAEQVFERPTHPYTEALIGAIPVADPQRERQRRADRVVLSGDPPSPLNPPSGCPFHPRCPLADGHCVEEAPALLDRDDGRNVACLKR